MEKFYVERAIGDQGGGRDEIYFTASSSAGGGGRTFRSGEFGAVKNGDTRTFSAGNKVFLDEDPGSTGLTVTSIQVWEADQSSSRWYDALQRALNRAVETICSMLLSLGQRKAQFAQAGQAGLKALLHRGGVSSHEDVVTQRSATGYEGPGLAPFCHPLGVGLEEHCDALFSQRFHDRHDVHGGLSPHQSASNTPP
ncbi:hypothetical protein [Streptomyces sp. NPDC048357]|uniref:hypothetical protein n=1 Tax=Streptomyces sp. NPDC048357 TaxID=3154719 RepID=UPI00343B22E9